MELREQIMADVKSAMVSKDAIKLGALRFLQAAIKNREIELRPEPISKDDVLAVIKKAIKQRKESIEQFQAAGRTDLVEKEQAELKTLEAYVPAQLSRDQVEKIISEVVAALGAKTIKDMGPVMKEAMTRTAGQADGKMLSEVIKSKLNG